MVNLFTAAICQISTVLLVYAPIKINILPKGDCFKCCPIDDEKDIRFLLFTRNNPTEAEQLFPHKKLSSSSNLNSTRSTIIYLHGFTEVAPGQSGSDLRDAYLSIGDYNIILIDWGALIALPWYISAVRNTAHAGLVLARFVQWLDAQGVDARALHVVGFSLGAEAAGLAGKELARRGLRLGRITGLDPAFPLYNLMGSMGRLSAGDALFVDVIHTNSGVFGYPTPIGDVDFYPNWGSPIQPGCLPQDVIRRRIVDQLIGCSHRRAWQLYVESIRNPKGFPARPCKSRSCKQSKTIPVQAYMGLTASSSLRGKYYLSTNSEEPYARSLG